MKIPPTTSRTRATPNYTGYLAAAKRLGISSGVGGNEFAPEQVISRQQMFTLLYNTLKKMNRLPEGDSGKTLSDFTDGESVSSYAQEALSYFVKTALSAAATDICFPRQPQHARKWRR